MHATRRRFVSHGLALAGSLWLAGCATGPRVTPQQIAEGRQRAAAAHDHAMAQWVGHDISDLYLKRGKPQNIDRLPNGLMLYAWDEGVHIANPMTGGMLGNVCLARYVVDPTNNKIVNYAAPVC